MGGGDNGDRGTQPPSPQKTPQSRNAPNHNQPCSQAAPASARRVVCQFIFTAQQRKQRRQVTAVAIEPVPANNQHQLLQKRHLLPARRKLLKLNQETNINVENCAIDTRRPLNKRAAYSSAITSHFSTPTPLTAAWKSFMRSIVASIRTAGAAPGPNKVPSFFRVPSATAPAIDLPLAATVSSVFLNHDI